MAIYAWSLAMHLEFYNLLHCNISDNIATIIGRERMQDISNFMKTMKWPVMNTDTDKRNWSLRTFVSKYSLHFKMWYSTDKL